jgi:hypothetical protein
MTNLLLVTHEYVQRYAITGLHRKIIFWAGGNHLGQNYFHLGVLKEEESGTRGGGEKAEFTRLTWVLQGGLKVTSKQSFKIAFFIKRIWYKNRYARGNTIFKPIRLKLEEALWITLCERRRSFRGKEKEKIGACRSKDEGRTKTAAAKIEEKEDDKWSSAKNSKTQDDDEDGKEGKRYLSDVDEHGWRK